MGLTKMKDKHVPNNIITQLSVLPESLGCYFPAANDCACLQCTSKASQSEYYGLFVLLLQVV